MQTADFDMDEEIIIHTAKVNFVGFLHKMDKNRQLIRKKTGRISYEDIKCHDKQR